MQSVPAFSFLYRIVPSLQRLSWGLLLVKGNKSQKLPEMSKELWSLIKASCFEAWLRLKCSLIMFAQLSLRLIIVISDEWTTAWSFSRYPPLFDPRSARRRLPIKQVFAWNSELRITRLGPRHHRITIFPQEAKSRVLRSGLWRRTRVLPIVQQMMINNNGYLPLPIHL